MSEIHGTGMGPSHGSGDCERVAQWLAVTAIDTNEHYRLGVEEEQALRQHLAQCLFCRVEAIHDGELVSQFRAWNERVGGPSHRFQDRLRTRLHRERVAAAKSTAPANPQPVIEEGVVARRSALGARGRKSLRRNILVAAFAVSLALNAFWVQSLFDGPPVLASAGPVTAANNLQDRLERLRRSQAQDGLVDADPVTTAWWLLAECRAQELKVPIAAPKREQIELAQRSLAAIQTPGGAASQIVEAGLRETQRLFRTDVPSAAHPSHSDRNSGALGGDNHITIAARQVKTAREREGDAREVLSHRPVGPVQAPLVASSSDMFAHFGQIDGGIPAARSLGDLLSVRPASLRAEALCALAATSALSPER
jgi:hypothetical protein